jgi:Uma2 family endonuclease
MSVVTAFDHPQRIKLTVDDFEMLCEAGALRSYHRTELINGEIIALNAQYRPHAYAKNRLARRLDRALEELGVKLEVIIEASVKMLPVDEPQPDIILTNAPLESGAIPIDTIALLVEVSDTTVRYDLDVKAPLYARQGLPELWVVDLPARLIRKFWNPIDGVFAGTDEVALGAIIESATIKGLRVTTEDLA